MVYVTKFRANDLNPSKGRQIEFNHGVVQNIFEFSSEAHTVTIECHSISDANFKKKITASFRLSPARGDYKIYQNDDGSPDLKDVFLSYLHLNDVDNINDYYALRKNATDQYQLYYIPKGCLFSEFFPMISGDQIIFPDNSDTTAQVKSQNNDALQRITYGAPGTGKSWEIDSQLKDNPKNVVRTTFHPDSDYATFVGAYKPTVEILPRMALVGTTMQKVTFGTGFTEEEKAKLGAEKKIVYKFVPQAFAKAYVRAWEKKAEAEKAGGGEAEKIYLVIEEINRGNCAQVFGDIFQLLDRPNGYSQYPILADDDLATWLRDEEQFGEKGLPIVKPSDCPLADDDWADVAKGVKLALPPNLFIWATMNTSDQSLFPMDSAFKRRWDWKYVPIVEGRDKNTQEPLGWTIEVKADGEGKTRNWWDFIRRVNIVIEGVTQSEDKKLGYFFAKPKDGGTVIDENTFVSKVVFYLWSEVLKDCPADDENVAVLQLDFADGKRLPKFVDFFDVEKNGEIDSNRVRDFLDAVEKVPLPKTAADTSADGDGAPTPSAGEAN